jgi:hypothetical protein
VAGFCEYGDELLGSGSTELVFIILTVVKDFRRPDKIFFTHILSKIYTAVFHFLYVSRVFSVVQNSV